MSSLIDVLELVELIAPTHNREYCSDDYISGGWRLGSRGYNPLPCRRCGLLELARGEITAAHAATYGVSFADYL